MLRTDNLAFNCDDDLIPWQNKWFCQSLIRVCVCLCVHVLIYYTFQILWQCKLCAITATKDTDVSHIEVCFVKFIHCMPMYIQLNLMEYNYTTFYSWYYHGVIMMRGVNSWCTVCRRSSNQLVKLVSLSMFFSQFHYFSFTPSIFNTSRFN